MELTTQQKELVLSILSEADGEDVQEIINESVFKDYLTRIFVLECNDEELNEYTNERNELQTLKKSNNENTRN